MWRCVPWWGRLRSGPASSTPQGWFRPPRISSRWGWPIPRISCSEGTILPGNRWRRRPWTSTGEAAFSTANCSVACDRRSGGPKKTSDRDSPLTVPQNGRGLARGISTGTRVSPAHLVARVVRDLEAFRKTHRLSRIVVVHVASTEGLAGETVQRSDLKTIQAPPGWTNGHRIHGQPALRVRRYRGRLSLGQFHAVSGGGDPGDRGVGGRPGRGRGGQ